MAKLRILVVEDSPTVRQRLCETLAGDPGIEVVGEAEDGKQAIELAAALRPDLVTMDMMLPVISGLGATEYIMAHCPTPILIVSASVNRGELFKTYEALAAGAVDVLEKPNGEEPEGAWERKLIAAVKLVARIPVITHPRARLGLWKSTASVPILSAPQLKVAAVGASTGGPGALVELLRGLPPDFDLPLLLVLHINEPFGAALADWLDAQTQRPVAYARDGEPIAAAAGRVLMAPPDSHLIVQEGRVHLSRDPPRHSCRPSVDMLFESLAHEYRAAAAGCLLTGMGRDGAAGLLSIRIAGGRTIAQDEASSVVYGMPREAAMLGAAERILPIGEIGPALTALAAGQGDP
ncbi:MAG: chemotaxis-specific protein-glutamate methyltransferase CheB [Sphingomonas sp.]|uniref:chemotaxis-specific protein-glutamate methyltransferase CheB n=1 Tax=Sphingomonas sp. TaxID=28214 RepID=UPI0022759C4A|nr:chemotaxis-specific protein-glutamate methyltransferase CheB [Sphingomonas sp.]MCX8477370.1 chemotaxis-specific protein-glutamate methyltransferase CheB [Sphingomonas sp.]